MTLPNQENLIAIVGMSGRFPKAADLLEYWNNLSEGRECISFFSDEELAEAGIPSEHISRSNYVKAGAMLEGMELFDASFFGYSPREAEIMDPQQRLLLESAWHALEDAGYYPSDYAGAIGVFVGTSAPHYSFNVTSNPQIARSMDSLQIILGNSDSHAATRISYKLDLKGPSVFVQTACSTSLVAVHMACQSLLNFESDMVLAGGSSITLTEKRGYFFREGGVVSNDGHCRPFDHRSKGTIIGCGVGMVALKRLDDAMADGDTIRALICGSSINNDGSAKVGYTAPSVTGQVEVISEALGLAQVNPEQISYVECHGTATELGDPIEIGALTQAYQRFTDKKQYCAIGSVKSNFGHLLAAAGVAALQKTVLSLEHKVLPPSLNFEAPNPEIDFENSPFKVNATLSPWESTDARYAAVSSFGIGGTNAHLILREAPKIAAGDPDSRPQLLVWSARSSHSLEELTQKFNAYFERPVTAEIPDIAYTLQVGRKPFPHRRFLIGSQVGGIHAALQAGEGKGYFSGQMMAAKRPIAMMFPGQGAQTVNMARELRTTQPIFAEHLDRCLELLRSREGLALESVLYPTDTSSENAALLLQSTEMTQPAIFSISFALAQLLRHWGIKPDFLVGHSIGEYVAATVAGVFSLEDALHLIRLRGKLMNQCEPGVMVAVPLSEEEVGQYLNEQVQLAAINGPSRCVLSGPHTAMEKLQQDLKHARIPAQTLATSHAFHSAMMDPILKAFQEALDGMTLHAPNTPLISNLTGTLVEREVTQSQYWVDHLRNTVRFAQGIETLAKTPNMVFIEVGPGQTLTKFVSAILGQQAETLAVPTLPSAKGQQGENVALLMALGKLWIHGIEIDWAQFHHPHRRLRVPLPGYAFDRKRFWIDAQQAPSPNQASHPGATQRKDDISQWFYIPSWKRNLLPSSGDSSTEFWNQRQVVLFEDETGFARRLGTLISQSGGQVLFIKPGFEFTQKDLQTLELDPDQPEHYEELVRELQSEPEKPTLFLHFWRYDLAEPNATLTMVDRALSLGFYSLLFLTKALAKLRAKTAFEIVAVTHGMHRVTGFEKLDPEKGTLHGPIKVIAQEMPLIGSRAIDLDLSDQNGRSEEETLSLLLEEISHPEAEAFVAYRGFDRWVQTYEAVSLSHPSHSQAGLRPKGTYLITGGMGGIGLETADYLSRTVAGNLILLARSTFPPKSEWDALPENLENRSALLEKIRRFKDMEARGTQLMLVSADVTDALAMQNVLDQARQKFGSLHGVVHAAGVPGGGMMQIKTKEMAHRVLAPKIQGTLVLDQLLKDEPLDFFVLYSSLSSVRGGFGQIDYCAANAFMDSYAHQHLKGMRRKTISINWGAWAETGMALNSVLQRGFLPCPFWLGEAVKVSGEDRTLEHPLLDRILRETPEEFAVSAKLSTADHWVLEEHRVDGIPTLPGTAYLELIGASLMELEGQVSWQCSDLVFLSPLIQEGDEPADAQIIFNRRGEAFEVQVTTKHVTGAKKEEKLREHARARIRVAKSAIQGQMDIPTLQQRCQHQVQEFDLTATPPSSNTLVSCGPRWNCVKKVWRGVGEGLVLLTLNPAYAADLQGMQLHPAMLDMAVGISKQIGNESGNFLPLSYGAVTCTGPMPADYFAYVKAKQPSSQNSPVIRFDISLMDEAGQVFLAIEDYTLRRITDVAGQLQAKRETTLGAAAAGDPMISGAILSEEGVEAFHRIIAGPRLAQVVVSTVDLHAVIAKWQEKEKNLYEDISKVQMSRPVHQRPDLDTPYEEPRNELEKMVALLWRDLLGLDKVGIQDDFFTLGGDSLLGVQFNYRLQEEFGIEINLATLFENPTIASIAMAIAEALAERVDDELMAEIAHN